MAEPLNRVRKYFLKIIMIMLFHDFYIAPYDLHVQGVSLCLNFNVQLTIRMWFTFINNSHCTAILKDNSVII